VSGYENSARSGTPVFTVGTTDNVTSGDGTYSIGSVGPIANPGGVTFYVDGSYSGDTDNASAASGCVPLQGNAL
jgi:hypothetical protein